MGSMSDITVSEAGKIKNIGLSQGKFLYGNFDSFYLITLLAKNANVDDVKKFMTKIAELFKKDYQEKLDNYKGDDSVFEGFSSVISEELKNAAQKSVVPDKAEGIQH